MDVEAKIKDDMKSLGCTSDMKIALACHLYFYLVDEKLMYDTEYCYDKVIDTLYIMARLNKNGKMNIYVPIPTSQNLSMESINAMQENLCTIESGPSINLAFIDGDFTTVIYTFTRGIAERLPPDIVQQNKIREERRTFINQELRKNGTKILNDALNGGVVDDDDCQIID